MIDHKSETAKEHSREWRTVRCYNPDCQDDHLLLVGSDERVWGIVDPRGLPGVYHAEFNGVHVGDFVSSIAAMEAVERRFENRLRKRKRRSMRSTPVSPSPYPWEHAASGERVETSGAETVSAYATSFVTAAFFEAGVQLGSSNPEDFGRVFAVMQRAIGDAVAAMREIRSPRRDDVCLCGGRGCNSCEPQGRG
jgi:hypothetical protein